ncbi:hypothetical protein EJB05_11335, partial [Eragrostis curvula]
MSTAGTIANGRGPGSPPPAAPPPPALGLPAPAPTSPSQTLAAGHGIQISLWQLSQAASFSCRCALDPSDAGSGTRASGYAPSNSSGWRSVWKKPEMSVPKSKRRLDGVFQLVIHPLDFMIVYNYNVFRRRGGDNNRKFLLLGCIREFFKEFQKRNGISKELVSFSGVLQGFLREQCDFKKSELL